MRFLYAAIACLAVSVSAQQSDLSVSDDMSSYLSDFDVSGAMKPTSYPIPTSYPTTYPTTTPIQQQDLPIRDTMPMLPVKSMKTIPTSPSTIMLQPIVLLPRQHAKAKSKLNFDIERALAYRVSPKVSAENSRSVNVDFTPILNAKMTNAFVTYPDVQQYNRAPIFNKYETFPVKYETAPVQQQSVFAPLQQQSVFAPLQQQSLGSIVSNDVGVGAARYQAEPLMADYGTGFQNINEQPLTGDYHTQPIHSVEMSGVPLLSSISASLPAVPVSTSNLVKLGVHEPLQFKMLLNGCVQQTQQSTVCEQVFGAAKVLIRSPVREQIFAETIQN